MSAADQKVTVHLPRDCATKLTTIAAGEGRTLPGELLWLAVKRVQRKIGGGVAKGKNDDEVRIMVRMPRELGDALKASAQEHERTPSAELRHLIREHLGFPQPQSVNAAQESMPVERDPFTGQ